VADVLILEWIPLADFDPAARKEDEEEEGKVEVRDLCMRVFIIVWM
jgi:hypothetical protein